MLLPLFIGSQHYEKGCRARGRNGVGCAASSFGLWGPRVSVTVPGSSIRDSAGDPGVVSWKDKVRLSR
jgi:hypothetical protein